MPDVSKVVKFNDFRWEGIPLREYKEESEHFKDVTRQNLLGDAAGEQELKFVSRYFEVRPGGYSSLEYHHHPHVVVILRGTGHVVLGDESHEIGPYDCVYVSPGTVHQFRASGPDPLGFFCVVDRVRDRPTPVGGRRA